jgi:dolichol kinase
MSIRLKIPLDFGCSITQEDRNVPISNFNLSNMVEFVFGELVANDILISIVTVFAASITLGLAYKLTMNGIENWKGRKLVHISLSTIIALTLFFYQNLTGPVFTIGLFLTVLFYAWAHNSKLIAVLLIAGSREGESNVNTFASAFMGLMGFTIVFFLFLSHPEIISASILTVSWGDAAGEVIGRMYGGILVERPIRDKSIEGFFGVFVFSAVAIMFSIMAHAPSISILNIWAFIFFTSIVIALIEIISKGWQDNFLIPLITAALMWIFLYPGVPLIS